MYGFCLVATVLGVARNTVSDWWGTSKVGSANASTPPDARIKVGGKGKGDIAERVEKGEDQAQVAADYGISQQRVSQIAKKEKAITEERERREEVAVSIGAESGIHHGDFREIGVLVESESVDLIFDHVVDKSLLCNIRLVLRLVA